MQALELFWSAKETVLLLKNVVFGPTVPGEVDLPSMEIDFHNEKWVFWLLEQGKSISQPWQSISIIQKFIF